MVTNLTSQPVAAQHGHFDYLIKLSPPLDSLVFAEYTTRSGRPVQLCDETGIGEAAMTSGLLANKNSNPNEISCDKNETQAAGRCKIYTSFCLMRQGRFLINNKNSRTSKTAPSESSIRCCLPPFLNATALSVNERWCSSLASLLERIGKPYQLRIAECATNKRDPDRQANDLTCRHGDARVTGYCGQ